jgi:hypothetical protein
MSDLFKLGQSRRIRSLAVSLCLLCASLGSTAQDLRVEGVAVSERITLDGQKLQLNGAGLRTLFGFRVYVASLYLPAPTREAARVLAGDLPSRFQITLLRDTTTDQNLDALKGGLNDNNSAAELDVIQPEIAQFFALIQQVHAVPAGTVIQLDYQPGKGTSVRFAGRTLGVVTGERFHRAILKIWLGGEPIQLSLKKALLGIEPPAAL